MTGAQQRAALQRQIWQIANDVRGAVDGWDFKQYVLGTLFYRFISENFAAYIEAGDESIDYAELPTMSSPPEIKDDAIKTKGYFIYPSQLFVNVAKTPTTTKSEHRSWPPSSPRSKARPTATPPKRTSRACSPTSTPPATAWATPSRTRTLAWPPCSRASPELDFGDFQDSQIDLFGDAYEFLISNYAANAGKSGGEFFTPQHVSKLIAQLAMHGQTSVNKIYDPACGSGSLLLQAKKHFDDHIIEEGFFGQEINHTTYNLARMNMFLHNINYDKFNIQLGDTLTEPALSAMTSPSMPSSPIRPIR